MSDDGVLVIDKPSGMTSFGVVARIRRVASLQAGKKVKVGHTGTLDPFATGLMILVIGKECRNASRYAKLDKVYEATFTLGQVSTTGDPEGEVSAYHGAGVANESKPRIPTVAQIQEVMMQFTGDITQRPPMFSAIKINGRRAYSLARDGREIEMPERTITVYALKILNYAYPELKVRTHVSSGTYIRSLAADIGEVLGVGAYCSALRRTKVGTFSIKDAKKLTDYGIID